MKIPVTALFALLLLSSACNSRNVKAPPNQSLPTDSSSTPEGGEADTSIIFRLQNLNESLLAFANKEYGQMTPDYSDPDNAVGTAPFVFVKRIECDVLSLDQATQKLIKKSPENVSFHAVVVLKDARSDLYAFTVTSTVPDKSEVKLRSFGPVTNENPDVVNLPISQRRLTDFPIDFTSGKPLHPNEGKCIFAPYPFPADQEYWLFANGVRAGQLQGLYRNDRYKSIDHLIRVIMQAVSVSDKL